MTYDLNKVLRMVQGKTAPKMKARLIAPRSKKRQPTKFRTEFGWRFPDGREVCDLSTVAGRDEYGRRIREMSARQQHACCFCGKFMHEPTFEHEKGRGGGKRDDRIVDEHGQPMNKAAHGSCNRQAGSPKRKKEAREQ